MNDATRSPSELTVEMFERSAVVTDLEPAEIDAWCSGLWLAWESDAEVLEFIRYCGDVGGPVAALVCRSLAMLADGEQAELAAQVQAELAAQIQAELAAQVTAQAPDQPAHQAAHQAAGPPVVVEGWQVRRSRSQSIVIGCGASGSSDHAVLFSLGDSGELVDVLLAGDPHELVYGVQNNADVALEEANDDITGLEDVTITPLSADEARGQATAIWREAAATVAPWPSTVRANEHLVRHRLGGDLPRLQFEELDLDPRRGLSPAEFAEANRAAMSTLQSALGRSSSELLAGAEAADSEAADSEAADIEAAWAAVIGADVRGLPREEQQAIVFLEWADWLGAGIGMARQGPGVRVDGEALVDFVNQCPEVSTTIDKRDRGYVAFAFDIALELVADVGGIVDGELTSAGHAALTKAMATVWAAS